MGALLPITANKAYIEALDKAARELGIINPVHKDEYAKLCRYFMRGWQASKEHTFAILDSIPVSSLSGPGDDDK